MAKVTIELTDKPVEWLKPDPGNIKSHTDEQVDTIVASIQRFGFNDPIGCDPKGVIIEGEGRLRAAKKLGMEEVPTLVIKGLTKKQKRKYAIAHNKLTLSTPQDVGLLRKNLNAICTELDVDWQALGFRRTDFDVDVVNGIVSGASITSEEPGSANRPTRQTPRYRGQEKVMFPNADDHRIVSDWVKSKDVVRGSELTNTQRLLRWYRRNKARLISS